MGYYDTIVTHVKVFSNLTLLLTSLILLMLDIISCVKTIFDFFPLCFSHLHPQACLTQISHSVVSDSLRPHESQHARPPLSITNSRSSPGPTFIESVMPSRHLILCRPLLLLPPIPPSIRVFSNESTLRMRWTKYWKDRLDKGQKWYGPNRSRRY